MWQGLALVLFLFSLDTQLCHGVEKQSDRSFFIALGHDEEVEPLHPIPISGSPIGGGSMLHPGLVCSPAALSPGYGVVICQLLLYLSPEISKDFDQNADVWALCHRSKFVVF